MTVGSNPTEGTTRPTYQKSERTRKHVKKSDKVKNQVRDLSVKEQDLLSEIRDTKIQVVSDINGSMERVHTIVKSVLKKTFNNKIPLEFWSSKWSENIRMAKLSPDIVRSSLVFNSQQGHFLVFDYECYSYLGKKKQVKENHYSFYVNFLSMSDRDIANHTRMKARGYKKEVLVTDIKMKEEMLEKKMEEIEDIRSTIESLKASQD